MSTTNNEFSFTKPAIYRIRVLGELPVSWSGKLSDMNIEHERAEKKKTITILQGYVRDQSALSGVLNTLYDLHRAVLSVEYLPDDESKGLEPKNPEL